MAGYTWADLGQMLVVTVWVLAAVLNYALTVSLDNPAYSVKCNKIISNPADVTACDGEAALGQTGCVKDFYRHDAWKTFEWWVYKFTPIVSFIELFAILIYLRWQKYGATWFLMVIVLALGLAWFVFAIIATTIFWIDCKSHDACSNARYNFDFTGDVKQHVANVWIAMCVTLYVIALLHLALFVASIITQACLSRAVGGRETGLNPLFTEEDSAAINRANNIDTELSGDAWLQKHK